MRASPVTLVLLVAACSGDTFTPVDLGAGRAGGAGTDGVADGGASGEAGMGNEAGASGGPDQGGGAGVGAGAGAGGSSGSGGTDGGSAGVAGGGGIGGAPGCPQLPTGIGPATSQCGNGVVEVGEVCDDGNPTSGDGCSQSCKLECSGGALASGHCYFVLESKLAADEVYDGPSMVDEPNDLVRPDWAAEPCGKKGVATHLVIFETKGEHQKLLAVPGFASNISGSVSVAGAWVGAGARLRTDAPLSNPNTWRNGEGGMVPDIWKTDALKAASGRCATMTSQGTLDNVVCSFPSVSLPVKRGSVCEREPACALQDGQGPHVGYVGPDKHCYARFETPNDAPVKRDEAVATCAAAGAHLPAFEKLAELINLTGANLTSGGVWVGARRNACAGDKLVWDTTGSEVDLDAQAWSAGQPTPNDGACVTMGRDRLLSSRDCDETAFVLCERDF